MTSHGKTSSETVTFEIYHSKNRIKIVILISECVHGSFWCDAIFLKVVKTFVITVSELKGDFRYFQSCDFRVFPVFIHHSKNRIKFVVFPVSWFKPPGLMLQSLVFPIHGLKPLMGLI